jgi:hypothetical protein
MIESTLSSASTSFYNVAPHFYKLLHTNQNNWNSITNQHTNMNRHLIKLCRSSFPNNKLLTSYSSSLFPRCYHNSSILHQAEGAAAAAPANNKALNDHAKLQKSEPETDYPSPDNIDKPSPRVNKVLDDIMKLSMFEGLQLVKLLEKKWSELTQPNTALYNYIVIGSERIVILFFNTRG